jgi:hypothetical protein
MFNRSQSSKKVEGTYKISHESDSVNIDFLSGFVRVYNKQGFTLLECSPNYSRRNVPICRYKVTISIEAMEENET